MIVMRPFEVDFVARLAVVGGHTIQQLGFFQHFKRSKYRYFPHALRFKSFGDLFHAHVVVRFEEIIEDKLALMSHAHSFFLVVETEQLSNPIRIAWPARDPFRKINKLIDGFIHGWIIRKSYRFHDISMFREGLHRCRLERREAPSERRSEMFRGDTLRQESEPTQGLLRPLDCRWRVRRVEFSSIVRPSA